MAELTETDKVKKRQVILQMENLKGKLSELEKGVAEIKMRLNSVLRDDTPNSDEKAAKDQESLVPLANDIRASANRVNMLNLEVDTLLRELEL
jgi:hypothetical protein